jgi:hypothetical protein
MKWFRKKNDEIESRIANLEQLVPLTVQDRHIVPRDIMREILSLPEKEQHRTKEIVAEFLKTLNRPELLAFEDADQFRENESVNDWIWEAYYEEQWEREWPIGKSNYKDTIPYIVKDTISDYDELKKQIQGIQKKLDRLASLMENTEITMSGKTALKL